MNNKGVCESGNLCIDICIRNGKKRQVRITDRDKSLSCFRGVQSRHNSHVVKFVKI